MHRPVRHTLPLLLAVSCAAARADEPPLPKLLTLDDAVHLALTRNREIIAAKLGVSAAEVERVAAGVLPNPQFSYALGNLTLGQGTLNCLNIPSGNPNMPTQQCAVEGFGTNLVHALGVAWELEVWGKRGLRIDAAKIGIEAARAQLADALRSVAYATTTAYVKLQHAEQSLRLAKQIAEQYGETVRVSRERVKKGALAGNDLSKIELEQTRFQAAVRAAEQERNLDARALEELMALPPAAPEFQVAEVPPPTEIALDGPKLIDRALAERPDLKAAELAERQAEKTLDLAHRVAIPNPALSLYYIRSQNTPAGDNADTLNLGLSIPLPIFDRNQGDIGRARVAIEANANQLERLKLAVAHDVAEAVLRARATWKLVDTYEHEELDPYGKKTNMLARADSLLTSARTSYQLGATSLLELLEAQRAYITTRSDYLDAVAAFRQALADLAAAIGQVGVYGRTQETP